MRYQADQAKQCHEVAKCLLILKGNLNGVLGIMVFQFERPELYYVLSLFIFFGRILSSLNKHDFPVVDVEPEHAPPD